MALPPFSLFYLQAPQRKQRRGPSESTGRADETLAVPLTCWEYSTTRYLSSLSLSFLLSKVTLMRPDRRTLVRISETSEIKRQRQGAWGRVGGYCWGQDSSVSSFVPSTLLCPFDILSKHLLVGGEETLGVQILGRWQRSHCLSPASWLN